MIQLDDWCYTKLPEKDGSYLITDVSGHVYTLDFTCDLNAFSKFSFPESEGYKGNSGFYDYDDVLGQYVNVTGYVDAWTNLPEPWKGDSKL